MPYFGTSNLDLTQVNPRFAGYVLVPENVIKIATGARPNLKIEGQTIENLPLYTEREGKLYAHEPFHTNSDQSELFWKDFDQSRFTLTVDGECLDRSTAIPSSPSQAYLSAKQKYHFQHFSYLIRRPLETLVNHALLHAHAEQGDGVDIPLTVHSSSTFSFVEIQGIKWLIVTEQEIFIKARFSGDEKKIPGEVITCYEVTEQGYVLQGMYAAPEMKINELLSDPETFIGYNYSRFVATNQWPENKDDAAFLTVDNTLSVDLWTEKLPELLSLEQGGLDYLKQEQSRVAEICIDNKSFNNNASIAFNEYITDAKVLKNHQDAFEEYHYVVGHPVASLVRAKMQEQSLASNADRSSWQFSSQIKSLIFKKKGNERYIVVVEHEFKFSNKENEILLDDIEVKTMYCFRNNTYVCQAINTEAYLIERVIAEPMKFVKAKQASQQEMLKDKESGFSSLVFLVNHEAYLKDITSIPNLDWVPFPADDVSSLGITVSESIYDENNNLVPARALLETAQSTDRKPNISTEIADINLAIQTQNFNPLGSVCTRFYSADGHGKFKIYQHEGKYYLLALHTYKKSGALLSVCEFDDKQKKFLARGFYASNLNLHLKIVYGLNNVEDWPKSWVIIPPDKLIAGVPATQVQFTISINQHVHLKIQRSKSDPNQIKKDFNRMFICADGKFLDSHFVGPVFNQLSQKYGWDDFEQSHNSIVGGGYLFVRSLQLAVNGRMSVSINKKSSKIIYFVKDDDSYFVNIEFLQISYNGKSWDLPGFMFTRCIKDKQTLQYEIQCCFASNIYLSELIDFIATAETAEALFLYAARNMPLAKIAYFQDQISQMEIPDDNAILKGFQTLFAAWMQELSIVDKKKNYKQIETIACNILKLPALFVDPIANQTAIMGIMHDTNSTLSHLTLVSGSLKQTTILSDKSRSQAVKYNTICNRSALKAFALFVVGSILVLGGLYLIAQTLGAGAFFGLGMAQLGFSIMGFSVPGVAVFSVGMAASTTVIVGAGVGGCAAYVGTGQMANKTLHAYDAYTTQSRLTDAAIKIENTAHSLKPLLT